MIDRARLIARDRVFLHELLAQLLDRRCLPSCQFGCARIIPSSNLGQPVLRDRPRLPDGQFAKAADRRLAPLAPVRAVLKHEYLAPAGGDFAEKAGNNGIAQFIVLGGEGNRIHGGFGELGDSHRVGGPGGAVTRRSSRALDELGTAGCPRARSNGRAHQRP